VNQPWLALVADAAAGVFLGSVAVHVTRQLLRHPCQHRTLVSMPLFGGLTAALFVGLYARLGFHPSLVAYNALAVVTCPLAAIDVIEHRLPTQIVVPMYPVLVVLFGLSAITESQSAAFLRALLGMLVLFTGFLALALATHGGLGAGDVRLAGLLGLTLAWQGWRTLIAGLLIGLLYGAATRVCLLVTGTHRHTPIPLGPSLLAGAFTALLMPA
jgi:leader peptidase (prepilin peptidase) / N-methyltransferase